MSTLEIRNEILEIVKNEDESSLQNLYQIIKNYEYQKQLDKMIEEGEEDIKAGRTYTIEEARKMIL
jgi:predicted house-cleaning noncanonical NTP pyrophosphatase (MazG superfamily)